jgi:hypothetical protein
VSDLTADEQKNVRAALQFLHARVGRWDTVARALRAHVAGTRLAASGRRTATASLAVRVARFAGVGVDDVLTGRFPDPSVCPHCGQRRDE